MSRRLRFGARASVALAVLGVVGLITLSGGGSRQHREDASAAGPSRQAASYGITLGDGPGIVGGWEIPQDELNAALVSCRCLAGSGPALGRLGPVRRAWTDGSGQFLLLYAGDTLVALTPDPRTPEEYGQSLRSLDDPSFEVTTVNGSPALAHELDALGPASVGWVEHGWRVLILSHRHDLAWVKSVTAAVDLGVSAG